MTRRNRALALQPSSERLPKHKRPAADRGSGRNFQFYISTLTFLAGRSTQKFRLAPVSANCAKLCAIPHRRPGSGATPASVGAFLAARFALSEWFTAQSPARSVEPPIAQSANADCAMRLRTRWTGFPAQVRPNPAYCSHDTAQSAQGSTLFRREIMNVELPLEPGQPVARVLELQ